MGHGPGAADPDPRALQAWAQDDLVGMTGGPSLVDGVDRKILHPVHGNEEDTRAVDPLGVLGVGQRAGYAVGLADPGHDLVQVARRLRRDGDVREDAAQEQ